MLYSLGMKFQVELVNFQDQLENRVLCKTFSSHQNSEVQPSVTKHEKLKMHFALISNVNNVNTIIYMQQNMQHFWSYL